MTILYIINIVIMLLVTHSYYKLLGGHIEKGISYYDYFSENFAKYFCVPTKYVVFVFSTLFRFVLYLYIIIWFFGIR